MPHLITTLGPKTADELGLILPHEHVFVDLRTWDQPGYAQAEAADVVALMAPQIEAARAVGVTALVECSTGGVGRRADLDRAVSEATGFPIVVPTGIYREPWVPDWAHAASEDMLAEWMLSELTGQIEVSGVQAGWIKLSAGDDGLTPCETKILRAAVRASQETGAVIGSHTIRGRVVRDQLDIIEGLGGDPGRFIWIHTQAEAGPGPAPGAGPPGRVDRVRRAGRRVGGSGHPVRLPAARPRRRIRRIRSCSATIGAGTIRPSRAAARPGRTLISARSSCPACAPPGSTRPRSPR